MDTKKSYRAAICGYGGVGSYHHANICQTDRITFTGVYDIDPARMALAQEKGIAKAYASYEELLRDPAIDLVLVSTPNNFHQPLVCEALRAGKPVICEKPVAMSSEELQTMIDTAAQTGVWFTVHQNRRRDADFKAVLETLKSGSLGTPFAVESRVNGSRGIPTGWRQYAVAGGGMMFDWGVHLIDQLLYAFAPQKVVSVFCRMYHVAYSECDDGFRLIMRFDTGLDAVVEVGTSHYIAANRWMVYGDRGALSIPDWSCKGRIVRAAQRETVWEEDIVYTKAGPTKTMAPRAKESVEEIALDPDRYVSDCGVFYENIADVLDGKAALLVRPEEAMRSMRVMEACFASDRTGQAISVNI